MISHSLRTKFFSTALGVGINLAANCLPVLFSTALCTTPNAPLKHNSKRFNVNLKEKLKMKNDEANLPSSS